MRVPKDSPLLKYYDFGGDLKIDSLRHSNGGYAYYGEGGIIPEGTEPLVRYVYDTVSVDAKTRHIHDQVCGWAYKKSEESGRVVITGSHPEMFAVGERLELMAAMTQYALEGNGNVTVKGDLIPGEVRHMDKSTKDEDPLFTKIGDRQYHHFTVEIPKGTKEAVIALQGYKGADNFDLTLAACNDEPAFHDKTSIKNVSLGCNKTLKLKEPKAGKWYISVFCETTVTAGTGEKGVVYTGRTDVLNGVPYKIKVEYNR